MGASGTGKLAPRGLRWKPGALIALIVAAVAVGLAGAGPAVAATTTVQVGQQNGGTAAIDQFNAASTTIAAGDTVHWAWFSNPFGHQVVSYAQTGGVPNWQSAVLTGAGQSFDHTFSTLGVFTYYCSIHALRTDADPANIDANIALGKMVGKVTVTASSVGGVASVPDAATLGVKETSGGGGGPGAVWLIVAGVVAAGAVAVLGGRWFARRARVRGAEEDQA